MSFRVEVAADIAACSATVAIQEETWSGDVIVPPQLLLAIAHNGGFVALGYAEGDERPAGFVAGFLGIHDHHFRHHSHMLAVRPPYRHTGLAVRLKEAQRDHCLDQGLETIGWTMDPLEARNARFNFAKLGTLARTYHRDFYGAMPDKLNEGLPSDRLYIEWPIATDRADARLRGAEELPTLEGAEREVTHRILGLEADRPVTREVPVGESHLLLEIPVDFRSIKQRDRGLALEWRLAARAAFETAIGRRYAAVEFLRDMSGARGAYLLFQQPTPEQAIRETPPGRAGVPPA